MSASSIFTSMRGHGQSSAAYGRLTVGTMPQRKCHHRINRSIAIADFSSHGRIGGHLSRKAQSRPSIARLIRHVQRRPTLAISQQRPPVPPGSRSDSPIATHEAIKEMPSQDGSHKGNAITGCDGPTGISPAQIIKRLCDFRWRRPSIWIQGPLFVNDFAASFTAFRAIFGPFQPIILSVLSSSECRGTAYWCDARWRGEPFLDINVLPRGYFPAGTRRWIGA